MPAITRFDDPRDAPLRAPPGIPPLAAEARCPARGCPVVYRVPEDMRTVLPVAIAHHLRHGHVKK